MMYSFSCYPLLNQTFLARKSNPIIYDSFFFSLQIYREFSQHSPVIYSNSIEQQKCKGLRTVNYIIKKKLRRFFTSRMVFFSSNRIMHLCKCQFESLQFRIVIFGVNPLFLSLLIPFKISLFSSLFHFLQKFSLRFDIL